MRVLVATVLFGVCTLLAGAQESGRGLAGGMSARQYVGFDRNEYPGDAALATLRQHFSFVGYWLTNPPGESANSWLGRREALMKRGFGFVVLANGREDAAIRKMQKTRRTSAKAIGEADGVEAVAAARREGFPPGTIVFLDQEEGGRLLPEQAEYLLGWTEWVAGHGYKAGVYASGQPVNDGPGVTITTAEDIRTQVKERHLREVTLWVYEDSCPPSNGCRLEAPRLETSGTKGASVWQYAQSPRRKENTAACAKTYAEDGNCYLPELPGMHLDLSVARSPDPSHGR